MRKIFIALAIIGILFVGFWQLNNQALPDTQNVEKQLLSTFSYGGQNGKDALVLLKEKTKVEQDNSGLVVSIKSRKADVAKKEYWAFYVNGRLSSVGPAEYQTKDGDKILWKIEKF